MRLAGCCIGAGRALGSACEARCPLDVSWEVRMQLFHVYQCRTRKHCRTLLRDVVWRHEGRLVAVEVIGITSSMWMCYLLRYLITQSRHAIRCERLQHCRNDMYVDHIKDLLVRTA